MYSEIKYDGERVQLHKQGSQFQFYSRSLKPVMAHKVQLHKHGFQFYSPSLKPVMAHKVQGSQCSSSSTHAVLNLSWLTRYKGPSAVPVLLMQS